MNYISRFTFYVLRRIDIGLIIAGLLTLLIVQNLLQPGLPTAADYAIHLYRTMEYKQAWAPGVILPRWAPNLAFGYGYPLFVFAPPLPYFLGLIIHALGFTFETALKFLIILTIPLYAIGMYLLAKEVVGSVAAGLTAGVAYAFAPFALREALLYGGNIPQFLAIGLFPWCLWALTRAALSDSWGWIALSALFYAGVILSHLFHALVFTPVVALYGLILTLRKIQAGRTSNFTPLPDQTKETPSTQVAKSSPLLRSPAPPLSRSPAPLLPLLTIPLGLLLSAFFWLPAFIERFHTRAQADIYLEKSPFFVRYPHWSELVAWIQPLDARAANPYVPLTLGTATLILAGLGLLAGLWGVVNRRRSGGDRPPAGADRSSTTPRSPLMTGRRLSFPDDGVPVSLAFFALIAAAGVFMSTAFSRPVWETIAILQVAEFPWRMLGLANLGLAFLAGAAMLWPPPRVRPGLTGLVVCCQILVVAPLLYPVTGFVRYEQLSLAGQINYERSSQSVGTTTLGEYLPRTVSRPPTTSPLVEAFETEQSPARLDEASLPSRATAALVEQNAVTHSYRLRSPVAFTLRMLHYDYPGWRAWLDDQPVDIRPEPDTGLMLIDVPAGRHMLTLRFGETPLRLIAMSLTLLTVMGLGLAAVLRRRQRGDAQPGNRLRLPTSPSLAETVPEAGAPASPRVRLLVYRLGAILLVLAAAWFKPWLRPFFTIRSPARQALPAQYDVDIQFEQGIRLIGYDLEQTVISPGAYAPVVLYWETDAAPLKVNLQPFVHLDRLDDWTTVAGATNYTPGDVTTESNMPTFHWDNARYVRDEHDLTLPAGTPPLVYALRVGFIDPDRGGRRLPLAGGGDTAQIAVVNVVPDNDRATRLANQLEASFRRGDDTIHLTGFQLDSLTPAQLDFTLTWRSDRPIQKEYIIFAQLLDMDQNLVTGFDRPPLDGAYPTSMWPPGQTVVDPRYIPVTDVSPGTYRLIVGLYDEATQQRLTTEAGVDFVELTKVVVGN